MQYGKITDFKYLIPDAEAAAHSFDGSVASALDDLDDIGGPTFTASSQSQTPGSTANPAFGRPASPDLSDLDETF